MIYFTENEIQIKSVHLGINEQDPYEPSDIIIKDDEYNQTHYLTEIIEFFKDIPTDSNRKVSEGLFEIIIRRVNND
jgi:ATP-dependent Clp protease adapter protein ClpS